MKHREEIIGGCRLILGDCREILPTLGSVDACVTDPPYGIGEKWKGGGGHGWGKAREETEARNAWDDKPPSRHVFDMLRGCSKYQVFWGGNYFDLPPCRGPLIWNKPERNFTLAEAEIAWTNRDNVARVFDGPRSEHGRVHPTQKPLALMKWSILKLPKCQTILDPYMGSGTTGVACVELGLSFTGIERDPKWFEVALKRISAAKYTPDMFIPAPDKPEQGRMEV